MANDVSVFALLWSSHRQIRLIEIRSLALCWHWCSNPSQHEHLYGVRINPHGLDLYKSQISQIITAIMQDVRCIDWEQIKKSPGQISWQSCSPVSNKHDSTYFYVNALCYPLVWHRYVKLEYAAVLQQIAAAPKPFTGQDPHWCSILLMLLQHDPLSLLATL